MQKLKTLLRVGLLYALAVVMIGSYTVPPLVAAAESSTPAVSEEAPKPNYTYNEDTQHWDTDKWRYDAGAGVYKAVEPSVPVPVVEPESTNQSPESPVLDSSLTPSNSQSSTASTNQAADTTVKTDASIGNALSSTAVSGDATVKNNTSAGGATSGSAVAETTIVNVAHSTIQGDTAGIAHFVSDIYGNVSGDITLSPAIEGATSSSKNTPITKTQVNSDQQITNDISLSATSGDAAVTGNTSAGSATSGSAHTVANVVNLINTIIAANKSFIGTINIYGNLNGDILVSPDFIPQLLADNSQAPNPLSLSLNDTQSVVNNITLGATSGDATVAKNTSAGGAMSGEAATNLTVLNLTGHQVVASNSMLVFVNVLGKWVGIIVDAPVGATAAMIGSGVTSNSGSTLGNTAGSNTSNITNNIELASRSGNATVTGNTKAGGATTGDATASANVLNISTSTMSLSGWFGILFINVFGTWQGSFGVNTASGEVIPLSELPQAPSPIGPVDLPSPPLQFGFVPRVAATMDTFSEDGSVGVLNAAGSVQGDQSEDSPTTASAVLAAMRVADSQGVKPVGPTADTLATILVAFGFLSAAGALTVLVTRRH